MNFLLDTHVLIWIFEGDARLKSTVRAALADPGNQLFVSLASFWEVGTKLAAGRLDLSGKSLDFLVEFAQQWNMQILPISLEHIRAAAELPFHHGDPFDRMLIAQANVEKMRLVSSDDKMKLYQVDLFW